MPITQENDRVLVCYRRSRQCERKLETEASEIGSCESVLIEASAIHTFAKVRLVTFGYAFQYELGFSFS